MRFKIPFSLFNVNEIAVRTRHLINYATFFHTNLFTTLLNYASLFTSVPMDKDLDLGLELTADASLSSRTSFAISDMTIGLKHCFSSTVFSYKNSFFKQIFGTPVGSCISPIIVSLFMEHVEHTAITAFHTPPSLWLRYVDDTFCILNKNHIHDFRSHLNSEYSHVQFIKEQNFSLSFLDVLVKRKSRNGSTTSTHSFLSIPQFTENPSTPIDIFTTRHIIPNIRSSLLPKLYSSG